MNPTVAVARVCVCVFKEGHSSVSVLSLFSFVPHRTPSDSQSDSLDKPSTLFAFKLMLPCFNHTHKRVALNYRVAF